MTAHDGLRSPVRVTGVDCDRYGRGGAVTAAIASSRSAIFNQRAKQASETPKSRAICARDASPFRTTAMTSWRNSNGTASA